MNFASIPGLEETKQLIVDAVRNHHLAHAQLFAGPESALTLPLALAAATYLHCENRGDDACGTCPACSKSMKYVHPDTHFVFPLSNVKADKDEERFKADIRKQWRSFLMEQPFGNLDDWTNFYGGENKMALISREESREIVKTLSLKPFESPHKVMIIWLPELMHPSAANGVLKILEEPPPKTYFILVTQAVDRLLPTIISRTQMLSVPLLPDATVAAYLTAHHDVEEKLARNAARLAGGSIPMALKLAEGEANDNTKKFADWMRACFKHQYGDLVSLSDDYHSLDKLSQRNLLVYALGMIRETLVDLAGADAVKRADEDESAFVKDFAKVMNVGKIENSYRILNEASYQLERNGSAKMIFLDLSVKLAHIINPRT